jgi:hypothetical protein
MRQDSVLRDQKTHCYEDKSPKLYTILKQFKRVSNLPVSFSHIYINVTIPSMLSFSKWFVSSAEVFKIRFSYTFLFPPSMLPHPAHIILLVATLTIGDRTVKLPAK